jgi:hypothetical protein
LIPGCCKHCGQEQLHIRLCFIQCLQTMAAGTARHSTQVHQGRLLGLRNRWCNFSPASRGML